LCFHDSESPMEATILIPTFDHCETLRYSVRSVQAQTVQDFEIFIVGDGAPDATRDLVSDLARGEPRIRFFEFPKGERNGESYRHLALEKAQGRCVCYLCDDDLWLPSHLEDLTALLEWSDLANTAQLRIDPSGEAALSTFDLRNPIDRALLEKGDAGFGLASGGHTLDAYRRLPHGWRTTPKGISTDTYMWQQFLEQPWCRAASSMRPTVLRFAAACWDNLEDERLDALEMWLGRATSKGGEAEIAWRVFESIWGASTRPEGAPRHARINPHSDFPPYELGKTIAVGDSRADFEYFSWGWSFREPWGVWSDGDEARLTFSIADLRASRFIVEARFRVSLSPKHPRTTIELIANGASVARWSIAEEGEHWRSVEIRAAPRIDLRFLTPHAPALNQIAETTDHRRLGIGLLALNIHPAP
jgi:GalNAc5-diNAcBac-PP-undecaprenol beta-1,3-glucosyltransferase